MPKRAIRQKILLERLLHQESEERESKDKKIATTLENVSEFQDAQNVLFYASASGEVDTITLIQKWIAGKNIYIPKVMGKFIHAYKITDLKELKKGKFGISEPSKENEQVSPRDLDLVLVPGVGFDEAGYRIGFGLGYYDRFLEKTNCPKIGLAYEFQIVDNVPGEPHDVPVDMIITEKRIINTIQ